jgi:hypothetical protein
LWDFARFTQLRAVIPAQKAPNQAKSSSFCFAKNAGSHTNPAFF